MIQIKMLVSQYSRYNVWWNLMIMTDVCMLTWICRAMDFRITENISLDLRLVESCLCPWYSHYSPITNDFIINNVMDIWIIFLLLTFYWEKKKKEETERYTYSHIHIYLRFFLSFQNFFKLPIPAKYFISAHIHICVRIIQEFKKISKIICIVTKNIFIISII